MILKIVIFLSFKYSYTCLYYLKIITFFCCSFLSNNEEKKNERFSHFYINISIYAMLLTDSIEFKLMLHIFFLDDHHHDINYLEKQYNA
jgi:hypothetical protein